MANSISGQTDLLQRMANDALRSAREQASRIGSSLIATRDAKFSFTANKPKLQAPPQFSDLFTGADSSGEQVQFLNGEVEKWLGKYFPELTGCLHSDPEQWSSNILRGTNEYGLDDQAFESAWQRGRDRAYRTAATEQKTLQESFSARGFTVPPGALLHAQNESEQRASNAIAEVNRAAMEKDAEIRLELLKFAEEQAIRLKLGIMDALRSFYMAWMQIPDKDIQRAQIKAQSQASLYNALSSYYNVEINFEELRLKAEQVRAGVELDNNKLQASGKDVGRNGALGQAVTGFANVAAAAGNAGGTLFANITTEGGS